MKFNDRTMIIDPDRDGCTVWYDDKVTHVRGNPEECVSRIISFLQREHLLEMNEYGQHLFINIKIDVTAHGKVFYDIFKQQYNITCMKVFGRHFID